MKKFELIFNKFVNKSINSVKTIINDNIKIIILGTILLIFSYLLYLSIPSFYNKEKLQKTLIIKLENLFDLNFSSTSKINYSIFPRPHFKIFKTKAFFESNDDKREFGEVKTIEIYISQKKLFKQDNVFIKKVIFKDANFYLDKNDFEKINSIIRKKTNKKTSFVRTNFFLRDEKKEILLLTKIQKLILNYKSKELKKIVKSNGQIFSTPYNFDYLIDFNKNKNFFELDLKKFGLRMKNEFSSEKENLSKNEINFLQTNLSSEIKYKKKNGLILINSLESRINQSEVNYLGKIFLKPFEIDFLFEFKEFDLKKFLSKNIMFEDIVKNHIIGQTNINGKIIFVLKELKNNNLFDYSRILINLNSGTIDLNQSEFKSLDFGVAKIQKGQIFTEDNNLKFVGDFHLKIDNSKNFYKTFQIPKKIRKKLENIYFTVSINFLDDIFELNNIKINNKDQKVINKNLKNINNWINFKKSVRKVFENYNG